jgi:ABC-type uncharacterized transport system substrate-binding protein
MKRRQLITTIAGGALASSLPAAAQAGPPVVGYLGLASLQADQPNIGALREGLRRLGYVEGRTIVVEVPDFAGDVKLAERTVVDMTKRGVAVLVAPGPAVTRIAKRSSSLPIVAIGLPAGGAAKDLYEGLAKPGGTITGFSTYGEELSAKRIQIVRQVLPQTKVVGILHNVIDPVFREWGDQTEASARAQGLTPVRLGLHSQSMGELSTLLDELHRQRGDSLIVIRDFLTVSLKKEICRGSLDRGIASVAELVEFAEAGALFSYGPDFPDLFLRAASYVDRILKGQKAADLPIQLPTKFQMAINLDTAKRLGLTVPPDVLVSADSVFE